MSSYKDSTSSQLLSVYLKARWVTETENDDVSEHSLKACVQKQAEIGVFEYNLANLERMTCVQIYPRINSFPGKNFKFALKYCAVL